MTVLDMLRAALGERYAIERELGRGGMGAVYLARDIKLERPVALKVLPAEYATQPTLRDRFLRETRLAAGFSHPNIVPVYAVEEPSDVLAYVMGFVEGESLAQRVRRSGPLRVREIVRLLQDVGYALAYAHGRGVVHRDVKPDNIMIERATGRALIMDFGISRVIGGPATAAEGLTRIGEVVGTPEYMSPEQATGDHVDGRSDLYSLGLVAHFAATGQPAVAGDTTGKVLARQITEELPAMRAVRPDFPAPLADAIDRCVAKDPEDRYERAEALVEALDVAQLAGPQVPLAVRMFGIEAETLSTLAVFIVFIGFFMWHENPDANLNNLDALLPMFILAGVVVTRVMQTFSEARGLARAGFSPDDLLRGMSAVVDERAERRNQLRADEAARRARRRTLGLAVLLLVGSIGMGASAFRFRHQIGPHAYAVEPTGALLVAAAAIALGVGLVLLLRNPFRAPLKERIFRRVWLGAVGRWFVGLASRGVREPDAQSGPRQSGPSVTRRSSPRPAASLSVTPARSASRGNGGDRVAALEARVATLEAWRREMSSPVGE
jgi:serine/threonine-protein kinase